MNLFLALLASTHPLTVLVSFIFANGVRSLSSVHLQSAARDGGAHIRINTTCVTPLLVNVVSVGDRPVV